MTTETKRSTLSARWPSALGLVSGGGAVLLMVQNKGDPDLGPGRGGDDGDLLGRIRARQARDGVAGIRRGGRDRRCVECPQHRRRDGHGGCLVGTWIWVLAQGRAQDGRWFIVQTLGTVVFGGLTIAAFLAGKRGGVVVAGVGWFLHGMWDAYHFAKDRVVVRSWSELCATVDILVGTALIVLGLAP